MRTAVVLAPDALTLHLMAWPFRLFIGGPLGDGRQWFTWIHIDDVVGLYTWVLGTASISGPVNVVAPACWEWSPKLSNTSHSTLLAVPLEFLQHNRFFCGADLAITLPCRHRASNLPPPLLHRSAASSLAAGCCSAS